MPEDIYSYRQPMLGHDDNPHFFSSALKGDSPDAPLDKEQSSTLDPNAAAPTQPSFVTPSTPCRDVRGASDVLIVLRTSKAELQKKLPAHLTTLFSCAPNVAIYSDHAGTLAGTKIPITDALSAVSPLTRRKNPEFREYDKMASDQVYISSTAAAAELDKWKFLPMVYNSFQTAPSHRFYLFLEADTSITWTNLLQWLDRLDSRIHYYAGVPSPPSSAKDSKPRFAQSAPGILLSWGALRRYAKSYEERYAAEWEPYVGTENNGAASLGNAMAESNVEYLSSTPVLQPETPSTMEWSERHWCAPVVSWVGVDAEEADSLQRARDKWTAKHGWDTPFLARDVFEEVLLPQLSKLRTDWDNGAAHTVIKAEPGWKEKQQKQKEKAEQDARQKKKEEEEAAAKEKEKDKEKDAHNTEHKHDNEADRKKAEEAVLAHQKEQAQAKEKEEKENNPQKPPSTLTTPNPAHIHIQRRSPSPSPSPPFSPPPPSSPSPSPPSPSQIRLTILDAASSAANCEAICRSTTDCLQWRYTPLGDGECHLGRTVRLGRKAVGKDAGGREWAWTSGWVVERVERVRKGWRDCEGGRWVLGG